MKYVHEPSVVVVGLRTRSGVELSPRFRPSVPLERPVSVQTAAVLRRLAAGAALALVAGGLAGCDPEQSMPEELPLTPDPVATSPAEPDEPGPEPEPVTAVEPIVLSSAGIGDVALNTPSALPLLLDLLGPANDDGNGVEQPGSDECGGPGSLTYVWWGGLQATFTGGTLYGWRVRSADLPPNVEVQHGVLPGAPYSAVVAIPGAPAPQYLEAFGRLSTEVDGIGYWSSDGSDPAATTVFDIMVNPIVCG
jgi:hypothetical protein